MHGTGLKVMYSELDINLLPNAPRVTFRGLSEADSWLNRGRVNYPLLWDRQRQPKPAFTAVVEALRHAR